MTKQVEDLCVFLRLIYESTKDDYTVISIHKIAEDLKIPYSHNIASLLTKKGILHLKHGNRFKQTIVKWVSKVEPNSMMAEALLAESKKKQQHHNNTHKLKQTVSDDSIVLVAVNKRKTIHIECATEGEAYSLVRIIAVDENMDTLDFIQRMHNHVLLSQKGLEILKKYKQILNRIID